VTIPVRTTPEVDAQIREIDRWWRQNRPAASEVFLDELAAAFGIIGEAPLIGRRYRRSSVRDTRRLLLRQTRYHVYYVPRTADVIVLAVWHARRGVGPPLRLL
jgi:plasmid stabilization system protein ParE